MSEKFLQALAEDPKLEKQIGCMTGLLQIFDRQQHLTGKRPGYKKIASKGGQSLLPSSMGIHGADGDKHENFQNVCLQSSNGAEKSMELLSQPKPCVGSKGASSVSPIEKEVVKSRALSGSSPNNKELSTSPLGSTKLLILPKEEDMVSKSDFGNFVQIDPDTPMCPCCEQDRMSFGSQDESLQSTEAKKETNLFCDKCRLHDGKKISETYSGLKKSSQDADQTSKSARDKVDKKASNSSARKDPNAAKLADSSSKGTTPGPKSKDQSMSYADLKQSLKVLTKLKDAPWNISRGNVATRCLLDSKDGSRHSSLKDPPRISYDQPRSSFEFKDYLRASQRSKESPRFSLDMEPPKPYSEFKNSLRSHSYKDDLRSFPEGKNLLLHQPQNPINCEASFKDSSVDSKIRSPSVVARLMGLEEIPDKVLTCPSTPTKPSREAKLLQGLLDYTPPHDQDKLGSDGSFSADAVEKKQDLWAKTFQPSKQLSDAVVLFQPEQSVNSENCTEKDNHKKDTAAQLYSPLMHSSRGYPKVLSGVWPHLDNVLKPLSAPRYVMETMPPHHKVKALYQQKPVVDALASFPKSSKATKIMDICFDEEIEKPFKKHPPGGLIKQHKSWDDILKALLQPELFKVNEYVRQAEKARLEMSATPAQLDRSLNRPHGSKIPKNVEEQVDEMLRKYFPTNYRVKMSSKTKHQPDCSGNALKSSRRIVKGTNSSESSPAREVSGNQNGFSSKSLPPNACKEPDSPRSVSSTCVSNRSSRSQQNVKLLMRNHAAQCDKADDPEGIPRIKYDLTSARFHSPHSQRIRSPVRSGSQFSPSKKMIVLNSSLENRTACAVRSVTLNDFRPLSLIKSFQDDLPDVYENSGSMSCKQPPENIFLQRSNSDVEMPSLESYDSSEGDIISDQHSDGLSLERIEVLSNYRPHEPGSQTEVESFRKDTSKGEEELLHQKVIIEDRWMAENQKFQEEIFAVHNLDGNEPLQSEVAAVKVNLLPEIPVIEQKPIAVASSFAEMYARHVDDQGCGGLPIENLITRVGRTEVVKAVAFPEIESPQGSLNSMREVLLRNNKSIGSTEKHCEQPSPSSVLDAACILDSFSPRIHRAKEQLDFGSGCSIPTLHEQNDSQAYGSLVDAEIAASLPAEEKLTTSIETSVGKGEMETCSDPRKVVMTENEESIYVHKILTASKYADQIELFNGLWCSPEKSVSSDYFFVLEQSNSQTGCKSKEGPSLKNWSRMHRPAAIYRRLLFDTVNDILDTGPEIHGKTQNLSNLSELIQPKKLSIQEIGHIVCTELQDLRRHSYMDVGDMLYSMIEKDLPKREQWHEFSTETQYILVAIERSIFKQLIEEAINCLIPTYSGRSVIAKHNCRKKLF